MSLCPIRWLSWDFGCNDRISLNLVQCEDWNGQPTFPLGKFDCFQWIHIEKETSRKWNDKWHCPEAEKFSWKIYIDIPMIGTTSMKTQ